jgi:imidazolonepropionase-like amidohydrolase
VPPNGGPDSVLIKGTRPLHANYEVIRSPEGRAAVQDVAAKNIKQIKIWLGDRNGTYPAMPREVYEAIVDEAHKNGIKVHAHATNLRDQKDALRAGVDLIVHTLGNAKVDDELAAIIKEKKPYWTPIVGSGDRSEVCDNDQFTTQVLSAKVVADVQAVRCAPNPNLATRDAMLKDNLGAMIAAGARIVLGTDAGIRPSYSFGSADHHELTAYVRLGMTPAQAIVAATSTPAQALGLTDVGALAEGRNADFLVLNANPLDDIRNTRQIANVYLRGARLDREALLAKWQRTNASQ